MLFHIKKILSLKNSKTIQNGALFSIFSFLNAGINFVLLIIIAGFISPEGYGKINLFSTTVQIFTLFICLNTSGIISVVFFKDGAEKFKRTINAVLFLTIGCFLLLSILVLVFSEGFERIIGLDFYFQWIALWICLLTNVTQLNLEIFRIEEKVKQYGFYSIVLVVLNFILTILLVVTFKYDWQGRIYAQLISYILLFSFSIIFLVKRGYITQLKPQREDFKESLAFGIPLIPHSATPWMRQGLDRYFVNALQSTAEVGLFSLAMNFANIINMIGLAFNQTNSVYIYKNLSSNNIQIKEILKKQTLILLALFLLITLATVVGAIIVIPILFTKYTGAVKYIPFLCLSGFFKSVYLLFCNYLFYYKKTLGLMYITFGCSILHIILSFWATRYSVFYTTIVNAVIDGLIAVGVFLYSRKFYKVF